MNAAQLVPPASGSHRRCDLKVALDQLLRKGFLLTAGILVLNIMLHGQNDGAAAMFKSKCSACHGTDGSGDTEVGKAMGVPDLHSADVQKLSDAELTDIIKDGKGTQMPAFKDKLTDDQIKQLVSYIREFKNR
jgi:cytochrome c6